MKTPVEFLQWLRPGGPWSLTSIVPDGAITTRLFTDPDEVTAWVKRRHGKENLYYAVNPLRPEYEADKKATKADVAAMEFLHVDVDHLGAELLTRIREHAPSVIIMSGNGYNVLWRLKDPVPAPADDDWSALEARSKYFEKLFSADHCRNVDRVLRLPFTWNLPTKKKRERGRTRVMSDVLEVNAQARPLSEFLAATEGPGEPTDTGPGDTHPDLEKLPLGHELSELIRSGDAAPWDGDHSRMIVAVALRMLHAGRGRDEIEATLLDPANGVSDHCLKHKQQKQQRRAAERAVDAALKRVEAQRKSNAAIFAFAKAAVADEHYASTVASKLVRTRLSAQKKEALVELVRKRSGESRASIKELFNAQLPAPRPPTEFLEAYVYVTEMKTFIHRESLREYDKEQFDKAHARRWPIATRGWTATPVFINNGGRQVYAPTYRPGRDEFLGDEYNLYRATGVKPAAGDITPWLDHAEYLIPDEVVRGVFFDRMAFDVQHPALKPNWHCFLGGLQGIGKNMFLQPVIAALGQDNCRTVSPVVLNQSFGDWLQGRKVIFIDEMMAFEKRDMNNKLKPLLTSPPDKLFINKKYGGTFDLPNLLSFYFGSNSRDAMQLEKSDRRLFMYWSDVEPRPTAHYEEVWKFFGEHVDRVVGFLARRDLSGFTAVGNAPMTRFKREVIEASRKPLERFLEEALEGRTWPLQEDLISINRLLTRGFPHGVGAVNNTNLGRALKTIGCVKVPRITLADGTKPMIWLVREDIVVGKDRVKYVSLSPEAQESAITLALRRWDAQDSPS